MPAHDKNSRNGNVSMARARDTKPKPSIVVSVCVEANKNLSNAPIKLEFTTIPIIIDKVHKTIYWCDASKTQFVLHSTVQLSCVQN